MTTHLLETDVMNACRILFGPEPYIGRGFLFYLQPRGAKSAYRKKAKETHPDFFYNADHCVLQQKTALFRKISEAYDIVDKFLRERQKGLWVPNKDIGLRSNRPRTRRDETSGHCTARKQSNHAYCKGPVPLHLLEIGRFLFYSGQISYWELIQALTWQKMQRPMIGAVAERWGWLAKPSIARIAAASNTPGRFGEKAVCFGLLSDFQVRTLLAYQCSQQERLGKYFIKNKRFTSDQLDHFVQKLQEHNARVRASRKTA
jgi:hypothetical protein